jgi:hypothetical protein
MFRTVVCICVGALGIRQAVCSTTALDNAFNPAYASDATGAWKGLNPTGDENPPGTDNGGFGFGTWNFAGGFQQPQYSPYGNLNHFIDGVDFAASAYNNLGAPAFGLTNSNFDFSACQLPFSCPFGGETTRATRPFSSPLVPGQTISFDFDSPAALTRQVDWSPAGIFFRLNTGGAPAIPSSDALERFGVFVSTGTYGDFMHASSWFISDAESDVSGVPTATGVALTTTSFGARFQFTLETSETYSVTLSRVSDGALLYSHSGNLKQTGAGSIDSIEFALFGNGSGNGGTGSAGSPTGAREFFFNDLRIEAAGVSGDYNRNGLVDAADYIIWRHTFGQSVPQGSGADGDNNGLIDLPDFDVWRSNFGATSGTGTSVATIPEPSSALLLAATMSLWLSRISSSRRFGVDGQSCKG